jgi:hypothetical protein
VVISPHIGGVTAASYIKMGTVAASNILAVTDATTVSLKPTVTSGSALMSLVFCCRDIKVVSFNLKKTLKL